MKANRFIESESGQINPAVALGAILAVVLSAAFLVIGTVVLQGIVNGTNISSGDTFYYTLNNITSSIESAMGLSGTLLLVIIGVAILTMLASVMTIMSFIR